MSPPILKFSLSKVVLWTRRSALAVVMICAAHSGVAQDTPLLSGGVGFFTDTNAGKTTYLPIIEPLLAAPIGKHLLIESRAALD